MMMPSARIPSGTIFETVNSSLRMPMLRQFQGYEKCQRLGKLRCHFFARKVRPIEHAGEFGKALANVGGRIIAELPALDFFPEAEIKGHSPAVEKPVALFVRV